MDTASLDIFKPALLRVAAAARQAGMSSRAFGGACKRGDIAVELLTLGPSNRFVRVSELDAFLQGRQCRESA